VVCAEGIALRQEMAVVSEEVYRDDPAGAVMSHAMRLAEVGRLAEAVSFSAHAVSLLGEQPNRDSDYQAALIAFRATREQRLAQAAVRKSNRRRPRSLKRH
jgi:hypothetical protein